MKFFLVSVYGDALSIAHKLKLDGHEVRAYISHEDHNKMYEGLLEKAELMDASPDEVLIFDMVGYGKEADKLRKRGYNVIGACEECDKLELDRRYGMQVAKKLGFSVPETYYFETIEDVKKFEPPSDGAWFFKPSGNAPVHCTFRSPSPKLFHDLLPVLTSKLPRDWRGFLVQREVKGVEVSTETWYVDGVPVPVTNHTFEDKRLFAGNLGPNTGCAGNVVVISFGNPALASLHSKAFSESMKMNHYTGPADANAIVTPNEIFFLEFTARFGYDALQTLIQLNKLSIGEFFERLTRHDTDLFPQPSEREIGFGIRFSIPPYPYKDSSVPTEIPIRFKRDDSSHIWWGDIRVDPLKGKGLVCAGVDGNLGVVTTSGSFEAARDEAFSILSRIQVPDLQYRVDVGERFPSDLKKLKRWGWL